MTEEEKFSKAVKLADAMYYAAQQLTTDASHLSKAMNDWWHHKVDLSDCSEEYRKAYYDGWNNCNQQHSQCNAEQKSADKVEPKFKIKYAGSEYNVLEVKDIAGVTFYGIEDEPNHIDYVQAENCEIVDGYSIKENDFSVPTKPIMFSEQKPAWSEGDETYLNTTVAYLKDAKEFKKTAENCITWLKSLKDRVQPKQEWSEEDKKIINGITSYLCTHDSCELDGFNKWYDWLKPIKERITWKPSDEQMKQLGWIAKQNKDNMIGKELISLYQDLKKLREE